VCCTAGSSWAVPKIAKQKAQAGNDADKYRQGDQALHYIPEQITLSKTSAAPALVTILIACHGLFPSFKISNLSRLALSVQ
jgi:hypothetical protein